ncbi:MAG: hypothetical protein IJX56_00890, partial [Alistipes sp.]|nr:hypothetical protein [Alistipes sp.]
IKSVSNKFLDTLLICFREDRVDVETGESGNILQNVDNSPVVWRGFDIFFVPLDAKFVLQSPVRIRSVTPRRVGRMR